MSRRLPAEVVRSMKLVICMFKDSFISSSFQRTETSVVRISALIYSSGEKLESVVSAARGQVEVCGSVCGEAVKGQFVKLFVVLEDFNNSWSPAEWGVSRTSEVWERISADEFVLSWRKHNRTRRRGNTGAGSVWFCLLHQRVFIFINYLSAPLPPAACAPSCCLCSQLGFNHVSGQDLY